jgi:LysR family hydrogen peroxide-inducible transcriptional activator
MTPIGRELSQRARAILAAARDLTEFAAAGATPMCGVLRLGVIPTIAPFLLPRALAALRKRYPRLQLALREDLTAALLARLHGGELDFVLFALPFDTTNLLLEPLFDDELWIVGRSDEQQLKPARVAMSAALADRLLLLEEGHCLRDHSLHACGATEPRRENGIEATSLLTLVQMIEADLGVGLVPAMAVKSGLTKSPRLLARPLARPCPSRKIALAARRSTSRLADLQALADVLRDSIGRP